MSKDTDSGDHNWIGTVLLASNQVEAQDIANTLQGTKQSLQQRITQSKISVM